MYFWTRIGTYDGREDYGEDRWKIGGLVDPALLAVVYTVITLRLDAEVLAFFKKTGERYQSRINAVLREYVRAPQLADCAPS